MSLLKDILLKYAFAENGDKKDISIESSPDGFVSLSQGYPSDYQKDPLAGGKYVERDAFNGVINLISSPIKAFQNNGFPRIYDPNISNLGGYNRGASCGVWLDPLTGVVNQNDTDWNSILVRAVSMVDGNTISPYSQNAFNGYWWIDDGRLIGEVRSFQVVSQTPPTGYLPLAPATEEPSYLLSDYERIRQLFDTNMIGQGNDFFKRLDDNSFTIINPRGRFPREWSNGSTIDNGRLFATLENDAIRNLTGDCQSYSNGFIGVYGDNSPSKPSGGVFTEKLETLRVMAWLSDSPVAGKKIGIDASLQVPTTDTITGENRPYNYNRFSYIKI